MKQKSWKNQIAAVLMFLVLMGAYLLCDRMSTNLFLLNGSWRMKTLTPYLTKTVMILVYAAFLFCLVKGRKEFRWGVLPLYLILFLGYLISTLVLRESLLRWSDVILWSLPAFLLASEMLSGEVSAGRMIHAVTILYCVLAAANILFHYIPKLYYIFGNWEEEYFLDYHTLLGFPLAMGAFFALLDAEVNGKKKIALVYLALYFLNQLMIHTGVTLMGALVILLYLIPFGRKLIEKCDLLVILGLVLALFLLLMEGLLWLTNLAPVKAFLENVLQKDVTLDGRIFIWTPLWEEVKWSPIFGYGMKPAAEIYNLWGQHFQAHNAFLQLLHEGGIFAFLPAMGIVVYTAKVLRGCENKRLAGICKMAVATFLLMLLADQYAYYSWYPAAMVCHLSCLVCGRKGNVDFPRLFEESIKRKKHDETKPASA